MTDLEKIRRLVEPFKAKIPFFARGLVDQFLTHEGVREMYRAAGGEEGVREVAEAIIRIGRGETLGVP